MSFRLDEVTINDNRAMRNILIIKDMMTFVKLILNHFFVDSELWATGIIIILSNDELIRRYLLNDLNSLIYKMHEH